MAHFAEIINNVVARVLVTDNSWTPEETIDWLHSNISNELWLQCSYNNNIRGIYPGIGYAYDPELDIFVEPEREPPPVWGESPEE